jgi:hypothetical protein
MVQIIGVGGDWVVGVGETLWAGVRWEEGGSILERVQQFSIVFKEMIKNDYILDYFVREHKLLVY